MLKFLITFVVLMFDKPPSLKEITNFVWAITSFIEALHKWQ